MSFTIGSIIQLTSEQHAAIAHQMLQPWIPIGEPAAKVFNDARDMREIDTLWIKEYLDYNDKRSDDDE
jgi:hypothetical protein